MTREEYLNQLKNCLNSLTCDELNEALQYYSDYFEESNDDQKVIAELGTPEELAKTISEKFANVPVMTENAQDSEEKKSDENYSRQEKLYFEFEPKNVQKMALNFGAADVVLISGEKYSLETRGVTADYVNCHLSSDGLLTIKNSKKINLNFWGHNRATRLVPRFLITVPRNARLNFLKISIGAGNFRTKDCDVTCQNAEFEVGAGNLFFDKVNSQNANFRCGMGKFEVSGDVQGLIVVDCGMGSVKLNLDGNKDDFSYDLKLGLGDFKFNSEKKSGVCKIDSDYKKKNHLSVNCGMGGVIVKTN